MTGWTRIIATVLALSTLGIACAPAGSGDSSGAAGGSAPSSRPALKRITLGMASEPDFRPNVPLPRRIQFPLVHSGLTTRGDQRIRHPMLAEAVPTIDNGLWKLLPDGRMETTWRLREGPRWHDGAPLTAEDLLFSLQVGRDREMSAFNLEAYALIEEASAPDPRTLAITWKEPFIQADAVLGDFSGGTPPQTSAGGGVPARQGDLPGPPLLEL